MRGGGGKGRKKEEGKGEGGKGAGLPTRLFLMAGAYVLLMFLWLLWAASCAFAAFLCPPLLCGSGLFVYLFALRGTLLLCFVLCWVCVCGCSLFVGSACVFFGCSWGGVKAAKPPFFTGFRCFLKVAQPLFLQVLTV